MNPAQKVSAQKVSGHKVFKNDNMGQKVPSQKVSAKKVSSHKVSKIDKWPKKLPRKSMFRCHIYIARSKIYSVTIQQEIHTEPHFGAVSGRCWVEIMCPIC